MFVRSRHSSFQPPASGPAAIRTPTIARTVNETKTVATRVLSRPGCYRARQTNVRQMSMLLADGARRGDGCTELGRRQGDDFAGVLWRRPPSSAGDWCLSRQLVGSRVGVPGGTARTCHAPLGRSGGGRVSPPTPSAMDGQSHLCCSADEVFLLNVAGSAGFVGGASWTVAWFCR